MMSDWVSSGSCSRIGSTICSRSLSDLPLNLSSMIRIRIEAELKR